MSVLYATMYKKEGTGVPSLNAGGLLAYIQISLNIQLTLHIKCPNMYVKINCTYKHMDHEFPLKSRWHLLGS
jgi:hypothetical protein